MLKNYIYQMSYQLLTIILPIVTTPYVSRILQPDGIGRYSVSVAIGNYFVLFGLLGMSNYGYRQVAYVRDDKDLLRKTFWEINILRVCTMGISIVAYLTFVAYTIPEYNKILYYIQIITLFASLIDISWFFVGLEQFKKTASRSIIFKIIGVICIFIFVKEKADLWLYAAILAMSTFVGQLILWFQLPKFICKFEICKKNIKNHLKKSLCLWLPSLAINIYTSLDKVMLGYMVNDFQVGLYENSQKIVKIASTITTSLSTVLVPRMSNLYKNNNESEFKRLAEKGISIVSFISFPICFGIIGIRKTLVPWFFGNGYEEITSLLLISSWLVITLGWSSIFGLQILVACNQEKKYTIAVSVGAVVNLVLNLLFIVKFHAKGALVSSVIAEYTGMFLMMFFCRRIFSVKNLFKLIPKYFGSGLMMCFIIYMLGTRLEASIITTMIQILVGFACYIAIMFTFKDENLKTIINRMKKR